MQASVRFCDLCLSDFKIKLATGFYVTPEGDTYDSCDKHKKEVESYGFKFYNFSCSGNSLALEDRLKG